MRALFRLTAALITLGLCASCGTEVKVGANEDKARELQKQLTDGNSEDGTGDTCVSGANADGTCVDDTGSTGGNGSNTSGNNGAALTCFGPAPALPTGFEQFCAITDATLREQFATSFATICEQKRLVNLLLQPCSWTGSDGSEKYRRVLSKTALDDQQSKEFHFYAAYGLTTDSSLDEQKALVRKELEDPNFGNTFVTIKNSRVFDRAHNADDTYDYTVELANSSATIRFRAHVAIITLSPDLFAVFDYAVSDKVIIKEHHFLRFVSRLNTTQSRIIGIEEKVVTDGGNHVLAYQNLTDVVKQREERDYENARRD